MRQGEGHGGAGAAPRPRARTPAGPGCRRGTGRACGSTARMSKAAAMLLAALLATLVACRSSPPRAAPDRAPAPPDTHEPTDGSFDWHGLLIVPFGSVLKEISV